MGAVYIGTSGYRYDDWQGNFYPRKLGKTLWLDYYSSRFNALELNFTYYAMPRPKIIESILKRTGSRIRYSIKANREMTHGKETTRSAFYEFREGIKPITESGLLGAVLMQFPWSFKPDDRNRDRIRSIPDLLPNLPVVVELRNSAWLRPGFFDFLIDLGLGFCCVDEPQLNGLLPAMSEVTSRIAYIRFHGRNAEKWWRHEHSWERYDYLYAEEELKPWVGRIREMAAKADVCFVFMNNHFGGNAPINAKTLAGMLELDTSSRIPGGTGSLPF